MVSQDDILNALPNVLKTVDVPSIGEKHQGKVRDFYILNGKRVLITTDRQSAFDVNLGYIPYKGAVLNQLAAFWFEKTAGLVKNHLIKVIDPNVSVVKSLKPVPVEMVVRGYISGVTTTSIWYSYERGEREIYGIKFPEGLKKNQKLDQPVITPTTHPLEKDKHDERLTRSEILSKGIVSEEIYSQMEKAALTLFEFGSAWCGEKGLILVDTKYEFGLLDGELFLMDEIHTPDSSRFWIKDSYQDRFERAEEPENFDKEFLRLWYAKKGFKGQGEPPKMTDELIVDLATRYIAVYEKITGKEFEKFDYPVEQRIIKNIQKYLSK